jgi:putative ABC transport system substrate-binding protein
MRRREFVGLIGGSAVMWPLAAAAQQPTLPIIGYLGSATSEQTIDNVVAFRKGLSESGYVEGQNVAIQYRWADGHFGRFPALAAELVAQRVAVIVVSTTGGGFAAKAATTTIPIVFNSGGDPVALGLVDSLSRPGRNITGVSQMSVELVPKRLQIICELIPAATVIALLVNPNSRLLSPNPLPCQRPRGRLGYKFNSSKPRPRVNWMKRSQP